MIKKNTLLFLSLFTSLHNYADDTAAVLLWSKKTVWQAGKLFVIVAGGCLGGAFAVALGANCIPEEVTPIITYPLIGVLGIAGGTAGGMGVKKICEKLSADQPVNCIEPKEETTT